MTVERSIDGEYPAWPRPGRGEMRRTKTGGHDRLPGINGRRPTLVNDDAYELVMAVATGKIDAVSEIAAVLRAATEPR
jgi:death-on-curing protein